MTANARPDPERTRRIVGAVLYAVAMVLGGVLLIALFLLPAVLAADSASRLTAMMLGAALAFPPLVLYLAVPALIDRYDPEPWWWLVMALLWGGIAACGLAGAANTLAEVVLSLVAPPSTAGAITACVVAPFVEELCKGAFVVGAFYFLRRDFDGVVDGVIYATFVALGFAAVENVTYYARAATSPEGSLAMTVILRGVLAPWGHPLYTSMTGIGFGIARESERAWVRWVAPVVGYLAAVTLHATWNTAATVSGMLMMLMLPLWFLLVFGFLGLVVWLVVRKGRIIRQHLQDEILLGNLTPGELALVGSATGRGKAWMQHGAAGKRFVATAARLGLCKWHAGRAYRGRRYTVSADWIAPLRQELHDLRETIARASRTPIERPRAWTAPRVGPRGQ